MCESGSVDSLSLPGSRCTVRCAGVRAWSQEIVGPEVWVPRSHNFLEIAPAKPCIIGGGYLLRSEDFMSSGRG